jgi:aminotransferase
MCAGSMEVLKVYEHFTLEAADHVATASIAGAFERTITVNSFSKSWAVSGWRLGYAYGPGDLVGKLAQLGNIYERITFLRAAPQAVPA